MSAFTTPEARSRYEQAYDRTLAVSGVEVGSHDVPTAFGPTQGRDDYVEWFTDVLAGFDVSRTAIAGNSYGGWLAANFALLRPELVSHVVMISPPLVFTKYRPAFYRHILRAPFIRSQPKAERFARWFVSDSTFGDETARSWLDQFSVGLPFFRGMNSFPRPKAFTDDELRTITAPVNQLVLDHVAADV
jgi:pimeloyl-ACP methyl ester carboxylesterase